MRSLPADLEPERVATALADGWQLEATSMQYVPEGGGSYHWKLSGERDQAHFVTVDDLDGKDWFGDTRQQTFDGLRRALGTAAALRSEAGLEFVVAPLPGSDGELLHRLDDRYSVSVFPFLTGRSYPFGRYQDPELRRQAVDMIAALHLASAVAQDRAPHHVPSFQGRADLTALVLDPDRPWQGGPFSEDARRLMVTRTADIARLTDGFDRLVEATSPARSNTVVTHGEPHPGNVMSLTDRVVLIDWDTVAIAPPERDVCLIAGPDGGDVVDRYQETTGRELDPRVLTLYRLRWYLDDLGSTIAMFRNDHRDTSDTRRWLDSLAPQLEELTDWLDLVG
jgi:spectinomycin phosphotransferase